MSEYVVELKHITKRFPGVVALKDMSIGIRPGEIHGLIGENGAGKSTLIKVLTGVHTPEEGEIFVDGQKVVFKNPVQSREAGIACVYQELNIVKQLPVTDNVFMGRAVKKGLLLDYPRMHAEAEEALKTLGHPEINVHLECGKLGVGQQQMVEIAKAVSLDAKLIIMDEPTTALTKKEVTRLFGIIEELKKEGITILFVSHKLDEVFEISDSITILRSGQNVYKCPAKEMTEEKFTYYMTGRNIDTTDVKEVKDFSKSDKVLEVKNLSAKGFEHVSFDLHAGEILGIAGQLGSGRTELSLALFGMLKPTNGNISVSGETVHLKNVAEAQKNGIALVPEDRLTEGLFLPQSIYKNISVTSLKEISGAFGVVKEAAQNYLDAAGTEKEADAATAYVKELEADIMPIDGLISFAGSDMGAQVFGADDAKKILAHAEEIKASGAKYCDCPACAACEALLNKKAEILK